ncbi:unnamed protein product [Adineta ricciae]|uniref:Uncharacterized protein n=1 Tax=Adineta ricciae TaxID=249248 RepID=A0A815HG44_ADIRI|nr:unnamed protein product [Adineta ricciae]
MAHGLADLIVNVAAWSLQGANLALEIHDGLKDKEKKSSAAASANQSPRAVLITASSASFARDCERAINIAFTTSQTFPTMMGTCADVDEFIRKELRKTYSRECFHIIIGENDAFGFSVDSGEHCVESTWDKYRIIIFSTKKNPQTKSDTHDANSQMTFKWK